MRFRTISLNRILCVKNTGLPANKAPDLSGKICLLEQQQGKECPVCNFLRKENGSQVYVCKPAKEAGFQLLDAAQSALSNSTASLGALLFQCIFHCCSELLMGFVAPVITSTSSMSCFSMRASSYWEKASSALIPASLSQRAL